MTDSIWDVILKDPNFDPEKYRADVPALIMAVRDSSGGSTVFDAIDRLRNVGSAAIPALWAVVNDPCSRYRAEAAKALFSVSGPSPELFEALLRNTRMVESPGFSAYRAIRLLCNEWPLAKEHYSTIKEFCKSDDRDTRTCAVMGLRRLGIFSSEIQNILDAENPSDDNESIILNTMPWIFINEEVGNGGFQPDKYAWAVPELIDLIRKPYYLDRFSVACALKNLGAIAREAAPALKECLTEKNNSARAACAMALNAVAGPTMDALRVIDEELTGTQYESATLAIGAAVEQLASSGEASESNQACKLELVRILGEMCRHTDDYVRSRGVKGLKRLGAA
jgi:hypothetical protein